MMCIKTFRHFIRIFCQILQSPPKALIMYKNIIFTYIISMETLDLKVICCDRSFKDFVLNLLKNDILSVKCDENISRTQIPGKYPPPVCHIILSALMNRPIAGS